MEIIQERLEREFTLDLITTVPGVPYRVATRKGELLEIHNPSKLPPTQEIEKIEEPYIIVDLDEPCRRQQVGEGWFASFSGRFPRGRFS